ILRAGRSEIRDLRGGVGHLGLLEPRVRQLSRPLPGGSSFVESARMERTKNLIAAYIGDGYLYGVEDHPRASLPSYWMDVQYEDRFVLVELRDVPEDVALALENQGLPGQVYTDGYEAARAAAPYVAGVIYGEPDLQVVRRS